MPGPLLIDLFAGAGGLSLGLASAGFEPLLAVELSPMAAETYFRNFLNDDEAAWQLHQDLSLPDQMRAGLAVATTEAVLNEVATLREILGDRELDLLAGGPPCQGFSLAGLRRPNDQRNRLPFQFLDYVSALSPKLVLIENVRGIASPLDASDEKSALEQLAEALRITGEFGYVSQVLYVNSAHYGVAQTRPRVMIAALRRDLAQLFAPAEIGDDLDLALSTFAWVSPGNGIRPLLAPPPPALSEWRTAGGAIGDLGPSGYLHEAGSYPLELTFADYLRRSPDLKPRASRWDQSLGPKNHVARRHSSRVSLRFKLHLALARYGVQPNVFTVGLQHDGTAQSAIERVLAELVRRAVPEPLEDASGASIRDEEGRDVASNHLTLAAIILRLSSAKHSQKALAKDEPAPTIMSLPDDFVHFSEPRTLTVREMARLQSFPDAFVFHAKETTGSLRRRFEVPQYTQVGNAVPPLLALAIGRHLHGLLEKTGDSNLDSRKIELMIA